MSTESLFDRMQTRVKSLQREIQKLLECEKTEQMKTIGNLESSFISLCQETSLNQRHLTAYEKRKMNVSLNGLQEGLEHIKYKLKPHNKLRWDIAGKEKATQEEQKVPEDKVPSAQQIETVSDESALVVFENLIDKTSNVTSCLGNTDNRGLDVRFLNCNNCCLYLNSWIRDCQVKGMANCKVMIGPVQTAAYVQECTDCVIYVAAQQVRIHDCQRCVLRVQSKQGSILERSKDIVFGPYNYQYPGIEEDFQKVGLYCEKDSWKKVRDFQFFSNRKEQHWRLMEESGDDSS
ncbi:hypothetical protein GpartN1_g1336.t1 [Galdieria partita]|uniref:C-CAP/cofactor C-like domain-containing protein n=1 Tax=Galdieria partita TaxID=83374 RepID=A0A9C7PS62_9RHOD|nr:hypothetical protein GpartN1_g1336.t1 [Galdieria partita]